MKIEMTVNVNIKWGKEQFKDIEVSLEEPPMVFKAQMFALSGVQPERQKNNGQGSNYQRSRLVECSSQHEKRYNINDDGQR